MDKMNYEGEEVHISTIQAGDTILHTDGLIRTAFLSALGVALTPQAAQAAPLPLHVAAAACP